MLEKAKELWKKIEDLWYDYVPDWFILKVSLICLFWIILVG